jgi:hypothetical protein
MYERRIEYSLYKTVSELRRLRLRREAEGWGKPHPVCATAEAIVRNGPKLRGCVVTKV